MHAITENVKVIIVDWTLVRTLVVQCTHVCSYTLSNHYSAACNSVVRECTSLPIINAVSVARPW